MIDYTRMRVPCSAARSVFLLILLGLVTSTAAGCQDNARAEDKAAVARTAAASSGAAQGEEVLATIDGKPVTMADLEELIGDQLAQVDFEYNSQRYTLIDSAMRLAVRGRLIEDEASSRGLTADAFIEQVIEAQVVVTDMEIQSFYLQNQAQLQGQTLEQLYPQIRDYLQDQAQQSTLDELAAGLAEARDVVYVLEPFRVDLDITAAPSFGPDEALVTLVEFSDFECPYCKQFNVTLEQVKTNYAGQLRVVFMQFPLSIHPAAAKVAEASLCAAEQGKFWEAHDLYFAEQGSNGVPELHEKAVRLGMDTAAFSACLDSDKYADRVTAETATGVTAGVNGTPAVYVNGRPLPSGAVPYEMVAEIIDDEIARHQRK